MKIPKMTSRACLLFAFVLAPAGSILLVEAQPVESEKTQTLQLFQLPTWGVEWVGASPFVANGRPLWRLNYYNGEYFLSGEKTFGWDPAYGGLSRNKRCGSLRFDAARQGFCAPAIPPIGSDDIANVSNYLPIANEGHTGVAQSDDVLLGWNKDSANMFSCVGNHFPVVSFFAPHDGLYVFKVSADGASFSGLAKRLGLNVAAYHGITLGSSSEAYLQCTPEVDKAVAAEVPITLRAGEEVGFVADTDAVDATDGATWENLQIRVNYLGTTTPAPTS